MLLKPVCRPCRQFFRPEKNGFRFVEGMPEGNALPGNAEPERWKPYKLWVGDLWKCPGCGAEIVVGVIGGPVAEHYQENFRNLLPCFDQLQVNDC